VPAKAEPLRLLVDADLCSRSLLRFLTERGYDILAAGLVDTLKQLDDAILFAAAQEQHRLVLTHNAHDFPDIVRDWAEAGRRHHGIVISCIPTNAYAEMQRRLDRWLALYPANEDWIDRAVFL
jgi:transposase-like protein